MTWTRHMASVKLAVLAGLARNGKWSEKCVEGGSGLVFEHIETGRTRNWIDRNCPCST
ncbi:hypothetical protein NEUTE1DRAFT_104638 [Neurospora tetrasperma FGSC 2508]|uniref:Uncharacterized protein n=1 Tax=Neurospora tetrasperma (strain FGSC 2508 / ATCC MYA-4615 / P0657) TaxID=510951 RepID=F8MYC1_NEUT8|nr:uncharacterized protein NEUTE1DRAFT_104638 [Neurospora tetrasperma FGSC 2508]EGO51603.1 hypothetical protein NEUTE1DRAFT_104638 [Neurospora tetrasperma FGSC 2508]